jgi:hypothetical protein
MFSCRVGDYKLIWGAPGFNDGRGLNMTVFYKDEGNLALVGLSPAQMTEQHREKRAPYQQTAAEKYAIFKLIQFWSWNRDDISSGYAQLFNLADDPNEYTNLATDPEYADKVTELKQYILDLLDEYVSPSATAATVRPEASPENYDGAWTSGWCEDLDLSMASP